MLYKGIEICSVVLLHHDHHFSHVVLSHHLPMWCLALSPLSYPAITGSWEASHSARQHPSSWNATVALGSAGRGWDAQFGGDMRIEAC